MRLVVTPGNRPICNQILQGNVNFVTQFQHLRRPGEGVPKVTLLRGDADRLHAVDYLARHEEDVGLFVIVSVGSPHPPSAVCLLLDVLDQLAACSGGNVRCWKVWMGRTHLDPLGKHIPDSVGHLVPFVQLPATPICHRQFISPTGYITYSSPSAFRVSR